MEKIEEVICPWCGKKITKSSAAIHIRRHCKEKPAGVTEKDIIEKTVIAFYGNVIDEIVADYKNLYSLPDLKKKYGINYKLCQRLLEQEGVEIRGVAESAKKITVKKVKAFCQEHYGVDNPSQLETVKEKKKSTFIEHYGVDNIWKTEEYKQFTRERWNSYDAEEKTKYLLGLFDRRKNGTVSNLEKRVMGILKDIGIPFESQYRIGKYFHRYDIRISDTKILLEVNGDFWHANPELYKEDDILNFSETNKPRAKDIWKKDQKNAEIANKNGFKVLYLWEKETLNKTDIEITKILLDKLNE